MSAYRSTDHRLGMNDYPSRETALALIEALKKDEASTWSELSKLAGVPDADVVAGHCFAVYGFPELAPGEVVKRLNEVFMKPRKATTTTNPNPVAVTPPDLSFGMSPRR